MVLVGIDGAGPAFASAIQFNLFFFHGSPTFVVAVPPILYLWEARIPIFRIHLGVLFSAVERHDRLAKSLCDNIAMMLRCSNFPFGICLRSLCFLSVHYYTLLLLIH